MPLKVIPLGNDQLFLLEITDPFSAGEANIASTELDRAGNLRISFHCGAFASAVAAEQAVAATALVVEDIRADVIESFDRAGDEQLALGMKPADAIETWLESTDDNPLFVDQVYDLLQRKQPALGATLRIVPSLKNIPDLERERYYAASDIHWTQEERLALLERMAQSGAKTESIDLNKAFRHVRLIRLHAGATLIEAGAPSGMVYVPLGVGLRIIPLGGYASFAVQAWMPLGNTSAIRGAPRNATIIVEQDIETLMIPSDVYLRHWYQTYTPDELRRRLKLNPPNRRLDPEK